MEPILRAIMWLRRLCDERGQTMSEYVILIAWISLAIVVAATKLGHAVSAVFTSGAGHL